MDNTSATASGKTAKVGKFASQRSVMWKPFWQQDRINKVICGHCKRTYFFNGRMTNLKNHLKECHLLVLPKSSMQMSGGLSRTSAGKKPAGQSGISHSHTLLFEGPFVIKHPYPLIAIVKYSKYLNSCLKSE